MPLALPPPPPVRWPEVALEDKLTFLRELRHAFGRTGLLLSGGGSFGIFHFGVWTALYEAGVLPRVISGSSAGAVGELSQALEVASMAGLRHGGGLCALLGLRPHAYRCPSSPLIILVWVCQGHKATLGVHPGAARLPASLHLLPAHSRRHALHLNGR